MSHEISIKIFPKHTFLSTAKTTHSGVRSLEKSVLEAEKAKTSHLTPRIPAYKRFGWRETWPGSPRGPHQTPLCPSLPFLGTMRFACKASPPMRPSRMLEGWPGSASCTAKLEKSGSPAGVSYLYIVMDGPYRLPPAGAAQLRAYGSSIFWYLSTCKCIQPTVITENS